MNAGSIFSVVAFAALALAPLSAWSQEPDIDGSYTSPSIKVGWNSRVGDLIEVWFDVVRTPSGGLMSPTAIEDIVALCKTTAAEKLTAYYSGHAVEPLRYYSVTISTDPALGMYARLYFETDGDCTPVRLSSMGS